MNFFRKALAWFGPKWEPEPDGPPCGSGSGPNGEYTEADVAVMNYDRHLKLGVNDRYRATWENKRVIEIGVDGCIHVGTVVGFSEGGDDTAPIRAVYKPPYLNKVLRTADGVLFTFNVERLRALYNIPHIQRLDLLSPYPRESESSVKPFGPPQSDQHDFYSLMRELRRMCFLTQEEVDEHLNVKQPPVKPTPLEVGRVKIAIGELGFRPKEHKVPGAPYVARKDNRKAPCLLMSRIKIDGNHATVDEVVWHKLIDECKLPQYLKEPGPHNLVGVTSSISKEFQTFLHRYENMEIRHLARWFDYWCNQETPEHVIIVE